MKNKIWIILLIVILTAVLLAAVLYPVLSKSSDGDTNASVDSSALADDFTVYDGNMNEVKLSDFFGKPIVVNFWASWCGPCKSELPAFDAMYKKYGNEVAFLMVNLTDGQNETMDGVKAFVAEGGYSFPVYYDVKYNAADAYGIYSIPETVFITADGAVYDICLGAMKESSLESFIKQIIAKKG